MAGKLGPECFNFYLGLGPGRSYEAVACRFGCTKRAVAKRAVQENWQQRLQEAEQKIRVTAEQKTIESLATVNEKHLKFVRLVQAKAIETLRSSPIERATDAVRALHVSMREERLLVPKEVQPAYVPHAHSILTKWCEESPCWHPEILAVTGHWGEKDNRSSRPIVTMVMMICRWLNGLVMTGKLDGTRHFHEVLLEALDVEPNPITISEMRETVFALEAELERYRTKEGIASDNSLRWITGMKNPDLGLEDGQTQWKDAFSCSFANDPITYVAHQLRERSRSQEGQGSCDLVKRG